MTRHTFAILLFVGLTTTLLTGCESTEPYVFEHGPAGPNTELTLENLPEGLRPDKIQASHTSDSQKPID